MGADLYLEQIHQSRKQQYEPLFEAAIRRRDSSPPKSKQFRTAQQEVDRYYGLLLSEGYFRDSYNSTNVLNRLGLSWWADVQPLCQDRKLQGVNLQRFRDRVAKARLKLPTKADLERDHGQVDEHGENSLAGWHRYFVQKRAALLAFLDQAIEMDSPIYCSL